MTNFLLIVLGACVGAAVAGGVSSFFWYRHAEEINNTWHAEYLKMSRKDISRIKQIQAHDLAVVRSLVNENEKMRAEISKLRQQNFIEVADVAPTVEIEITFGG